MSGAIGIISFPQFLSDSAGTYFQGDVFPLLTFLGGGFGGPGGDGFWSLLFLILVIILTAILTSLLAGVLLHTVVWALSGGAKAGAKALTMRALSDPSRQESGVERHPIVAGIARGALVGVLTGIVQSTFTVLGVMQFYGRHS
jgi:hypothetical protein